MARKTMAAKTPSISRSMTLQAAGKQKSSDAMSSKQIRQEQKAMKKRKNFTDRVLQNIDDMLGDIENVYDEITRQAPDHINQKDRIMTFAESDLLCLFLKAAHNGVDQDGGKPTEGKEFEVLVCETAPFYKGHETASKLHKEGIDCKLVTDSSVFALMSGVDKVIISTHAVMANGGLIAHSGAY